MSALRCGVFAAMVLASGTALAASHGRPLVIPNDPSQIPDGGIHAQLHPVCSHPLAKIKAEAPKGAKFETLKPGPFHFARGLYVGTPNRNGVIDGQLPPGDGAILETVKGEQLAVLLWMEGDKMCVPFPIPLALADLVMGTRTAPDEKAGVDDAEGETHL